MKVFQGERTGCFELFCVGLVESACFEAKMWQYGELYEVGEE